MDRLISMDVFRTVVDEGAFSRAARRLQLSNASVTKHVASLEENLGTRLLHRTTRRLSLTTAGRAYYDRLVRILEELSQLERDVAEGDDEPSGRLRVAAPMSYGIMRLSPLIPDFLAKHPRIEVDLTLTDRLVDVVEEGVDLVIRVASTLPDSTLIATRVASFPRVLAAAPSYLRAHGEPAIPNDLANHACIRYSRSATPDTWRLIGAGGQSTVRVGGPLSSDNSLAMKASLLGGVGIAMIPAAFVDEELQTGQLVRCLPQWEPEARSLFAIYPNARHLSAKVRAFIAHLRTNLSPGCGSLDATS